MTAYDEAKSSIKNARLESFKASDHVSDGMLAKEEGDFERAAEHVFAAKLAKRNAKGHIADARNAIQKGAEPPAGDGTIGPETAKVILDILADIDDYLQKVCDRLDALEECLEKEGVETR